MSGLKQGYHIRRRNQKIKLNPDDVPSVTYPNGSIPFFFNITVFLLILVLGILYGNKALGWYDIWVISSVWSLCFNGMWFLGRKNFLNSIRYQIHVVFKNTRLSNLTDIIDGKRNITSKSFDNLEEFNLYVDERYKYTKKFYVASWLFSVISFTSSLITMFILRY